MSTYPNSPRYPMRVAAIQMTSTPDKSANLAEASRLLEQALDRRVDLVAFPENFSLFTDNEEQLWDESETLRGVTVETLQEWAAENEVWILGGTIPLKPSKNTKSGSARLTNSSLLLSPEGELVARYDKIHLFDAVLPGDRRYEESSVFQAGKRPVWIDTPFGGLGLSVCYDLRFPELYRAISAQDTVAFFVPSAFTEPTGKAHWDVLTRARAIENQAYVIAPAQTGSPFPGRKTYGHTRIVDPWGRVIAERPAGPGIVWADLDYARLDQIRSELPALQHRKL